ncbi:MAG: UDP-glucose/GDP-mannose dehydrogenase family protein [Microbacteriaceae bacterium]|nr:UDP-glucose/GDP-mannose dehydrogenase family protein [Microbacteriaceae bacterium]
MKKIVVIGLGYLGATTAVALNKMGNRVIGIDPNPAKIASLSAGTVPFFEPGLDEALTEALDSKQISFHSSYPQEAKDADIFLLCVGTPQAPGTKAADLRYLEAAIDELAPFYGENSIVVGKSTVPVGTAVQLKSRLSALVQLPARLAWNPEFLREGNALFDSLSPDRLVIGTDDAFSERVLDELYAQLTEAGTPMVKTDIATAELVKVAANSFLATKISFINAMAEISEQVGADAVKLAEAIGHDARIGNKFLRTGLGFGGGCLPKDIRAFQARAEELGLGESVRFLDSVEQINTRRRNRVIEVAQETFSELENLQVTVLGAAFKPETDDIRDSPAIAVAELFASAGSKVRVHDPKAVANVRAAHPQLAAFDDLQRATAGADLIVIGTDWFEYGLIDPAQLASWVRNRVVIDGRNILPVAAWQKAGWKVVALGRSIVNEVASEFVLQ